MADMTASPPGNMTNMTSPDDGDEQGGGAFPSIMLLGTTAFIMMLFYMTHSHVPVIRHNTWSVLATAVSIFVAVMIKEIVLSLVFVILGDDIDSLEEGSSPKIVIAAALQVIVFWALVTALLFLFRAKILRLKGYGMIGGHLMGFASIHLWHSFTLLNPFRTSAWWIFPVVFLIFLVFQSGSFVFFHSVGACFGKRLGMTPESQERWSDQCKDTGTDFMCLAGAWILCTWIETLIVGEYNAAFTAWDEPLDPSKKWALRGVAFGLIFMCALLSVVKHFVKSCQEFQDILSGIVANFASFCLLDSFNWDLLPNADSEVMGKLAVCVGISMIAMVGVIIVAIVDHFASDARRALKGVLGGMALAVGCSWEKTFDAAVESLDDVGLTKIRQTLIAVLLAAIVFPAWMLYMLTKSDPELRKIYVKNPPPVWALCCDCGDHDEYDEQALLESDDDDEIDSPLTTPRGSN